MATKSSNYDPDSYGNSFEIMPEGVHQFIIEYAEETYKPNKAPQWRLELQPIESRYALKNSRPYMCWLPEDGVVEALYDAMGIDPATVKDNRDYKPEEFVSRTISAVVYHKKQTKDDGAELTFANIRRLHPAFNDAGTSTEGVPF